MKSFHEFVAPVIASFAEWEKVPSGELVYFPEMGDEACPKQEFIDLCEGDVWLGYCLLKSCEWQHPATVLDEDGGLDDFRDAHPRTVDDADAAYVLEGFRVLGFKDEADYHDHKRVMDASKALGEAQKLASIAAGSTAFSSVA